MLEIKITAPEISEAINNLARAIGLAVTNPVGMTIGVVPTNTTSAAANVQAEPQQSTPAQAAPTETVANPTVPVSAPQTAPVAQNTQNANYPTNAAPAPAPAQSAPTQAVPTAAPQYTLEMIAKAGTALIDAGKMAELSALLAKYGVEALTTLDPAHYGTFAAELRAMGAAI